MSLKTRVLVQSLLAVVFWGASFIATKVALREVSPVTIIWLRFAMGVVVLGTVMGVRRRLTLPSGREFGYYAALGFLGITFHQWLQSNGLVTSQATTTAWIVAATPIFIALLGWGVLKESLELTRAAGIGVAALGVLLVVTHGDIGSLALGEFGRPGDILILISSLNWAVFSVLSRQALKGRPASQMIFYVSLIGWLFTGVLLFSGPGLSELGRLSPVGWSGIVFLGIFCSGLAYIFWYEALQVLPASQVGVLLFIEPLVTAIVAGLLLGESLGWLGWLGGAVILLGVWLVTRPLEQTELRAIEIPNREVLS